MLDQIPPEVIAHIAYHLILPNRKPPVNLLCTCKTIYTAISPSENPNLYAKVFRAQYDIGAAARRISQYAEKEEDETGGTTRGKDLESRMLLEELRSRTIALGRLRDIVQRSDVWGGVEEGDLWVVYIMLIENDGKNITHLLGPNSINLTSFLQIYLEQNLLAAANQAGYPTENTSRALILWISWLISGHLNKYHYYGGKEEDSKSKRRWDSDEDEYVRLFVLRPYVFAAQEYELCFAPWTIPDLPLRQKSTSSGNSRSGSNFLGQDPSADVNHEIVENEDGDDEGGINPDDIFQFRPYQAKLIPRSRKTQVNWYGRKMNISPPMLTHAAILWFFKKWSSSKRAGLRGGVGGIGAPLAALGGGQNEDIAMDRVNSDLDVDDSDEEDLDEEHPTDLLSDSKFHDRDFQRLINCYDATICPGMPRNGWKGTWEGCWEGSFSFFEFDSYGDMLAGQARALYDGQFGTQAQVWKLRETYVRPIRPRDPPSDDASGKGKGKRKGKEPVRNKGLPLRGPMTNAGFPTELPSTTRAGLASAAAEAATMEETIKQQVEVIPGYERVPIDEVDDMLADPTEEGGLEMLLTGTGHSAWGRFILKGRVRAWDGLATLVKEYAPDSRGKWIYRGYVLAGDVFVGRWRDTFTPETLVGYEGTFILNRR